MLNLSNFGISDFNKSLIKGKVPVLLSFIFSFIIEFSFISEVVFFNWLISLVFELSSINILELVISFFEIIVWLNPGLKLDWVYNWFSKNLIFSSKSFLSFVNSFIIDCKRRIWVFSFSSGFSILLFFETTLNKDILLSFNTLLSSWFWLFLFFGL